MAHHWCKDSKLVTEEQPTVSRRELLSYCEQERPAVQMHEQNLGQRSR